ncbi:cell wall-binding repeat-containing protein [Embleya sp. NPDC050493]|uniref:cell wall-binding repeat-containing protein n=1 Tax=Embleya sp. NPDC050493 TaxID=3363989 RepID=UPI00379496A1
MAVVGALAMALVPGTSAQAAPGDPVDLAYVHDFGGGTRPKLVEMSPYKHPVTLPDFGMAALTDVSPDGLLLAGFGPRDKASGAFRVSEREGGHSVTFATPGVRFAEGAFSADGSRIYLVRSGEFGVDSRLVSASLDGSAVPTPMFPEQAQTCDGALSVSETDRLVFRRARDCQGGVRPESPIMSYDVGTRTLAPIVEIDAEGAEIPLTAKTYALSPDGKQLAYFPAKGSGLRVLDLTTKRARTVTGEAVLAEYLSWAPDGRSVALAMPDWQMARLDIETGRVLATIGSTGSGSVHSPVWLPRPVRPSIGVRVYGSTAIDTAVATSRFKYDSSYTPVGPRRANVAVLTRDDAFYDGLAGAGLAGAKGGPMLLTPKEGVPTSVLSELHRVLTPGSTVYVLGDESVVGAFVDRQLATLGLVPKRLGGRTVAETGIAIANEMTTTPKRVLVATAAEYYDALAAGAAAGSTPDTAVVFSWGESLPAATSAYLNGLDRTRTQVTAVGGPAVVALNRAGIRADATADGRDAADTAQLIAGQSFTHPEAVAIATVSTWQDALTGGALIAGRGPLLLTANQTLSQPTAAYLRAETDPLHRVIVVGGSDVVSNGVADQAVALTGLYGLHGFVDSPDGDVRVPFN